MNDLSTGHTLYTVGYAHLDSQWRWSYPQMIREFIYNTLVDNFALFEKYPDYVFNFSGSRRYMMMKEYYPEEYELLKHYIAQGRWFPCGSSVDECDVNVPSPESLIRQVLYGNRYFREEFNTTSAEFILPDCFGFPASMPNVLAHCGLRGFSSQKLTWGSANGIPFNVGVWEGLDGKSAILAAFNPGDYVGEVNDDLSYSEDWLKRIDENGKASGVYADFHYFGTGDVGGAPAVGTVRWIDRSVNSDGPVRVICAPAEQMFKDIQDSDFTNLPRYKGDLLLTEHSAGSITSQAYMKRWNRMNELLACGAELTSFGAGLTGGFEYPREQLYQAWALVLGSQMHDTLPGTCHPESYEFAWNDEVIAMNMFADIIENASGSIVAGMDTTAEGRPVVVFNPLSIAREDPVQATIAYPDGEVPSAVEVFGSDGKPVPAQVLSATKDSLEVLILAEVPSCGFAVFDVRPGIATPAFDNSLAFSANSLENKRYRVTLNDAGDVSSIYDKQLDRELLIEPFRLAFTHDVPGYWPAWNIDWDDQRKAPEGYVDGPVEIELVESGPVRVTLEVRRQARDSKFRQRVSLCAGDACNRVEFSDVIDWLGRSCNLKAEFPLSASNPWATYNLGAGTIMRSTNDEKKYEVPAHQWIDLTDESGVFGVTMLSRFKYGSDKPDDHTLRLTLLRTPGVHSHDYADQASQDWGRHEISYGLTSHSGSWQKTSTYWQAYRLEQPLIAFTCDQHQGDFHRSLSLAQVSDQGVKLLAIKQAEDMDKIIVRLVELDGVAKQDVQVGFLAPVLSVSNVDGQEHEIGPATNSRGTLLTDFAPYELKTFAVSLKNLLQPCVVRSKPVELPCNVSVATNDGEATVGGFDGDGRCLAAEMLPESLLSGGVGFKLAPAGGDKLNAVSCKGQNIALPSGDHNCLFLIAASSPQAQDGIFSFDDGSSVKLNIQDWGGFIGRWDNRHWDITPPEFAFQWPYKPTQIDAGYIKRDPVAWYCSHRHKPHGQNSIYDYSYLYRYRIDLPEGVTTITLPDNPNVKIMAASLAKITDLGFQAAHPLYDTLEDNPSITELPEIVYEPK